MVSEIAASGSVTSGLASCGLVASWLAASVFLAALVYGVGFGGSRFVRRLVGGWFGRGFINS